MKRATTIVLSATFLLAFGTVHATVADAPGRADQHLPAAVGNSGANGLAAFNRGACEPTAIERALRAKKTAVNYCYQRALRFSPDLVGAVTLDVRLAKDGSVTGVRVAQNASGDRGLASCLVRTVKRIQFPARRAACQASLPFMFGGM